MRKEDLILKVKDWEKHISYLTTGSIALVLATKLAEEKLGIQTASGIVLS